MRNNAVSSSTPWCACESASASLPPNPAVFVVGSPGSGASLVARLLDAHHGLAIAPDVQWVVDFFATRAGLNVEGLLAPELVHKWSHQKRFDDFRLGRDAVWGLVPPGTLLPYGTFLTRLLDLYGDAADKRRVGSFCPDVPRYLPDLHALWPAARFVHVVRDGRDVALALGDWDEAVRVLGRVSTWGEDPVATAALWWRRKVRPARAAGAALGPGVYYEVRYEALLARPAAECARLCAFLNLPYDDAMTRHLEHGGDGLAPGERPPDWRSQMAAGDVEQFEAAAGDLLEEMGYARAAPRPGAEAERKAARVRDAFAGGRPASPPEAVRERRRAGRWANPFVFVVGCPRSGTTLLQRMLDAHPDVAICPETFWIPYFFKKRIGLTPEGLVTPALFPRLFEYYKFYRMRVGRADLEGLAPPGGPVAYADFVAGLFDRYGEDRGKPLVGDKTPDYARNVPTLHTLWPAARFVHLIRDGRDVSLSAVNWKRKAARLAELFTTWGGQPFATAALWWEWHVRPAREAGAALGPGLYHEVRYEALVARPAEECARLCAFLNLPYDDAMTRFHEGRARPDAGLDAKNGWLPPTAGLRDWRSQMEPKDVVRFEAAAGDLLDELGYPRATLRPDAGALALASGVRERFVRDTVALGDWLP